MKDWIVGVTGGRGDAVGVGPGGALTRLVELVVVEAEVCGRQTNLADVVTGSVIVVVWGGFYEQFVRRER